MKSICIPLSRFMNAAIMWWHTLMWGKKALVHGLDPSTKQTIRSGKDVVLLRSDQFRTDSASSRHYWVLFVTKYLPDEDSCSGDRSIYLDYLGDR